MSQLKAFRLVVVCLFAACSDSGNQMTVVPPPSSGTSAERPGRPDRNSNPPSDPEAPESIPSPDAAVAMDAQVPAGDAAISPDGQGMGDAGAGGDGGSGPAEEAMWSHTDCDKGSLMFPNIDKNMGKFPIGSCPPPENLNRACGGNSAIAVMGMNASASSYETGYWHPPEYAVDEHLMTRWSSNSGPNGWLALDLGEAKAFKRIYLAWELAHASDYDIETSEDGSAWQTLKEVRGGNGYQDIVDLEGQARHIRIRGVTRGTTDTGGEVYGYSLFDVVICGERP